MVGKANRNKDLINLTMGITVLILINYIGTFVFHRFDLTQEKRFTLSEASKELVAELDDYVYIQIYLAGDDLPAGFKRLKNATREMLDEIRAYSGDFIEYEFIDPSSSPDEAAREEVYVTLTKRGLQYTNLQFKTGDTKQEKIIFPGAILTFRDQELPLQLLKSQLGTPPEVMLNNSIQTLEFELVSAISKLTRPKRENIAFLTGHGELKELEVADITNTLNEYYNVARVDINGQLNALDEYDLVVIAKPDSTFEEKDKFVLDQFIMNGGKSIWLIDNVQVSMDSLVPPRSTTMAIPQALNLEDQLFRYGVRINTDLVMDLQSVEIPIVTGYTGNQPNQQWFPWFYFPLIRSISDHAMVKNLNLIKSEFVNTVDTVGAKGIKKTFLLHTSEYTKVVTTPNRVSLNVLRDVPDQRQYNKKNQPIAVLLEGSFQSVFQNRIPPQISEDKGINFKSESTKTAMLVVADGDIIKNPVSWRQNKFFPLGWDKYTQQKFGNKDFVLNAVNYLLDDTGLIEARSKEIKLRMLDLQQIDNDGIKWQMINTVIPVVLIILFGLTTHYIRKKRYA